MEIEHNTYPFEDLANVQLKPSVFPFERDFYQQVNELRDHMSCFRQLTMTSMHHQM